jgi:hypothetical protein
MTKAEGVGFVRDLYSVTEAQPALHPNVVDTFWEKYESRLTAGLDALKVAGPSQLAASMWVRGLLPFVTGLFVRGPDFNKRFDLRLGELTSVLGTSFNARDNTNLARLFELQRQLSGFLAAEWTVGHIKGRHDLITNDLGYAVMGDWRNGKRLGYAIPISPRQALVITPSRRRPLIFGTQESGWLPVIGHHQIQEPDVQSLKLALAGSAQQFIVGPDASSVEPYTDAMTGDAQIPPDPAHVGFPDSRLARVHELQWYRLASVLKFDPGDERVSNFEIDWEEIARDWHPAPMLAMNLPMFPPAFLVRGNAIWIDLYEVPGLTTPPDESSAEGGSPQQDRSP